MFKPKGPLRQNDEEMVSLQNSPQARYASTKETKGENENM